VGYSWFFSTDPTRFFKKKPVLQIQKIPHVFFSLKNAGETDQKNRFLSA